jgi:hypothetical protein
LVGGGVVVVVREKGKDSYVIRHAQEEVRNLEKSILKKDDFEGF